MEPLLLVLAILPFIGFFISLVIPRGNELWLSRTAFVTAGVQLAAVLLYVIGWVVAGHVPVNVKELVIYRSSGYEFFLDLYFDKITALYLFIGAMLSFLITIYSRYYLHREEGFKRFFNTILFFISGYTLTVMSGNLETLFIGWEMLGISSFLLIAYYRHCLLYTSPSPRDRG